MLRRHESIARCKLRCVESSRVSNINIKRELDLTEEQVQQVAEKMSEKLSREYGVDFSWKGHCAQIKGPGVTGTCEVSQGSIAIDLNLGFLVAAFKERIEQEIEGYLDRL